ncbi:glycosyl hydrolase 53 family protein [Luteimicrobium xylanilyticum]|uniref:Arabinogalactan endo-beta-1,4-galactanase n=1 Tax=Luteimicrobium xylanilyticum TaxID=1133546 RepID=A0A5P9Q6R4_9MICO|nr:glycosyl hydrolase 53 family protein [Luteimicrobium xylanilyticum]QFU96800.1 Arabinogalactan endo-beta-1,4-galactanase [Luteimicrobium xylanilyticum]
MNPSTTTRRRRVAAASAAVALAATGLAGATALPAAAHGHGPVPTPQVVNPGFEDGLTGWTVSGSQGTSSAAKTEDGGHDDSANRLTEWSASAYRATVSQRVTGVTKGWWTASAWVRSGGGTGDGTAAGTLTISGCGKAASVSVPDTTQDGRWVRLAVSTRATSGTCTLAITTDGPGGAWLNADDVALTSGVVGRAVRGGDLSSVAKNEDLGAVYRDARGRVGDPVRILADQGMNLTRVKVFVNPADGYNDVAHAVATAKRAQRAGMRVLVDFHYSDTWADPGAQKIPSAWSGDTPAQLAEDVRAFTTSAMRAFVRAGVRPDYVQVGNEINSGMLFPWGQTWDVDPSDGVDGAQFDNLASFLTAGSEAVTAVSPSTKVILHLTNINQGTGALTWWLDEITARDVPFDVIGLSYYGYWHGSLADLQDAISTTSARYDRDVLVVETAYPFTLADDTPTWENTIDQPSELVSGYPATPAGQAAQFRAVQDAVASAPGGRGLGAVYWEPAWTDVAGNGWDPADPTSGNAWENQAMFDFGGRLLPAARDFAPTAADRAAEAALGLHVARRR